MKKLFLVGALALFGAMNAQTGNFKLGAHLGLPMGDASDAYSFTLGVDAAYLWPVSETFNVGLASGYSTWLGKTVSIPGFGDYKVSSLGMVPLAASAEYKFSPQFGLGADLGYGFLFASGESDGGFYYQPKATYHFDSNSEISLGYSGVSKNGTTLSALNLGYAYTFGK